jgi:formyltetrahydrofolate deformylase
MTNSAILLISCPDRKGLVAAIADFLYEHNGNILHADQHQDAESGVFLMRIEWDLAGFALDADQFRARFAPIAAGLDMRWSLAFSTDRPRVALLVSRDTHCLADLLYRHAAGELACDIPLVVSNHPDAAPLADFYGVPFHHIPISKENKAEAEAATIELLRRREVDLVVLARYMQILSPSFTQTYADRIINIHHSFLPAFIGARPYHQAYQRGVKLIGATSHYVTEILDNGPIIEQDVARVSHRDTAADMVQKGRDLEKIVLSRAVRWHIENRVLLYGNKTVVFD